MNSSCIYVFFLIFFLLLTCNSDIETDLKKVLKSYPKRDPNCTFNYTHINSTTIKFFPQCSHIYGIFVIDSNTDITLSKLIIAFTNIKNVYGGIRIENTNLTTINLFSTTYINIFCEHYGFYILNNPNLYIAKFLNNINYYPTDANKECSFYIENNPQLNMEVLCSQGYLSQLGTIKTKGNLKDCGCQGDEITSSSLPGYRECTTLYNGLKLYNLTDIPSLSALSNIKVIRGNIDIQNTLIQNLSFLESMKLWSVRNNQLVLNLQNNTEMTRLPFSFFGKLDNPHIDIIKIGNIERLHPDFCLTIEDVLSIFYNKFSFNNLQTKICDETGDIGEKVLCRFESLNNLLNNCDIILGDLVIDHENQEDITKLMEVSVIIGSLTIRNTELMDLERLGGELFIMSLNDSYPAIQIVGNKKLKSTLIVGLENLITNGNRDVLIQDNNPSIFKKGKPCKVAMNRFKSQSKVYRTTMNFVGSDCDPQCAFNYTEINSKTIKFFPKCSKIYGIIVINNNTNLSNKQLEKVFSNMTSLVGGMRIEHSNLTNLWFFPPRFSQFFCEDYGLFILNNEMLTDAKYLSQISYFPIGYKKECEVSIENNSHLDMGDVCSSGMINELTEMRTTGNLVNCGCQGGEEMSPSSDYSSCYTLYRGLYLSNITDPTDLFELSNLRTIRGKIEIQNTNIQNLSFLENLRYMKVYSHDVVFNLENNPNMTRLDLPFEDGSALFQEILNFLDVTYGNIENLHPDFCMTIDEFKMVTRLGLTFKKLDAKLCEPIEEETGICFFKSMNDLFNNCFTIIGNLIIGPGDEEHVTKLLKVSSLFGSLTIQNTQLANFSFFDRLSTIVYLEETNPVIQIMGNKNLTYPKIGLISAIHTRYNRTAIIQDNHPSIFNWTNGTCELFGNSPYKWDLVVTYRRNLSYIGADCGERVDISVSSRIKMISVMIILFWMIF